MKKFSLVWVFDTAEAYDNFISKRMGVWRPGDGGGDSERPGAAAPQGRAVGGAGGMALSAHGRRLGAGIDRQGNQVLCRQRAGIESANQAGILTATSAVCTVAELRLLGRGLRGGGSSDDDSDGDGETFPPRRHPCAGRGTGQVGDRAFVTPLGGQKKDSVLSSGRRRSFHTTSVFPTDYIKGLRMKKVPCPLAPTH